jgi:hypothetical protein
MTPIKEHTSFKHFLKNRILDKSKILIIKNDEGKYLCGSMSFVSDRAQALSYNGDCNVSCHSYCVFNVAKRNEAKVYLGTLAGDVELPEKDFQ